MTIRAAVMTAPGAPIEVRDLPDPDLLPGSVLLETIASEVCGTDVHLWHGRLAGVPWPIVPGHVSVGRVADLRGVETDALGAPLAVGDAVTFYDVHEACGDCYHCLVAGQPNRCARRRVYGITYSADEGPLGGWAEAIHLLPGVRILRLPDGLEPDDVIGGGCGLFTGFAAVERADIALGDTVLVQGSGPVGLAAAAFAALRGAAAVLVVGAPRARLDLALRLGADDAIDVSATSEDAREAWIAERTGGRGADVAIEATGSPAAVPEGLRLVRDGGTYVVAGHYTDAGEVGVNPHTMVNRKHVEVRGQWGTDFRHVARALAMAGKYRERLPFRDVIGGRYGLDEAQRALEDVAALRVTKAVIAP
jgi:threonine dehydrogenase-like Zn-dependent dehydrogenase